jgi:broad specificity phosphatase PhoE
MRLYFVRHGESFANTEHVFANANESYSLTEKGRQQAEALANSLKGIRFSGLYSSPVLRAVETSEILSKIFSLPVILSEALREFSVGILEGRKDPEAWELFGDLWKKWFEQGLLEEKIEGGVSLREIRELFDRFIGDLAAQYENTGSSIILVSHGGLLHAVLPALLSNIDPGYARTHNLGNTAVVITELQGNKWVCLVWGSESFIGEI